MKTDKTECSPLRNIFSSARSQLYKRSIFKKGLRRPARTNGGGGGTQNLSLLVPRLLSRLPSFLFRLFSYYVAALCMLDI